VIGLLAAIIALCVVPADFNLHAKGTLEPANRKDIYAGVEGQIFEFGKDVGGSTIKEGSWVKKGQLLLKLRNPTLSTQCIEAEGQVNLARQQVNDISHELATTANLRVEDQVRLNGQLAEARQKLISLQAQADIQRAKLGDLEVFSPIDGQITTSDLKNRLEGRPVQKGQSLLRVADPEGDWQLDLHMTDDRMGHVMRCWNAAVGRQEQLPVSYILATEPGTTLKGTVKEIMPSAEVHEKDEGNVVLIKVAINKADIDPANLRAGATVTGKVYCGRRPLGYVWFYDLLAFIQAKVFFRFF
jgi:multidrug efflux pump subunit AcrA (membrane-fusion protein)